MRLAHHIRQFGMPELSGDAKIIRDQRERIEELEEELHQLRRERGPEADVANLKNVCRRFNLRPMEGRYLFALLAEGGCSKHWLAENVHVYGVNEACDVVYLTMAGLRRQMKKVNVAIQNVYGEGWYIEPHDKVRLRAMMAGAV